MDEIIIKQKIQDAFNEPRPPEILVQAVIKRMQAVAMGEQALKDMLTAPAEELGSLAACALVGQLASVTELPEGVQPEELAQQLRQAPAFNAALRGGNILRRVQSGELMQQLTGQELQEEKAEELPELQKEAPVL